MIAAGTRVCDAELLDRAAMLMRGSIIIRQEEMAPRAVAITTTAEKTDGDWISISVGLFYPPPVHEAFYTDVAVSKRLVIEGSMGEAANAAIYKINVCWEQQMASIEKEGLAYEI